MDVRFIKFVVESLAVEVLIVDGVGEGAEGMVWLLLLQIAGISLRE